MITAAKAVPIEAELARRGAKLKRMGASWSAPAGLRRP